MAELNLLSSILKKDAYPKMIQVSAPYCCGTVTLKCDSSYTNQMLYELPNVTVNIYLLQDGEYVLYESRALSMAVPKDFTSISSILIDIPTSCIFAITPDFDKYAFESHNESVKIFDGETWTKPTETFPLKVFWDNTDVWADGNSSSTPVTPSDGSGTGVAVMPDATVDRLGNIVQYVGPNTADYTSGYFYKCEQLDNGTFSWVNINVQPAPVLEEDIRVNTSIGGLTEGTIIEKGTTLESLISSILTSDPLDLPTVSLSFNPESNVYGFGDSINSLVLIADVTKGKRDIETVHYLINDEIVYTLNENISEGGVFEYTVTYPITSATKFEVMCQDGLNTVTSQKDIVFVIPYFYGVVEDVNNITFDDFSTLVTDSRRKKVTFTSENKHAVIAFESTYSDLTSIRDENGLENISSFNKTIKEIGDKSYKVYISMTPITCNDFDYFIK